MGTNGFILEEYFCSGCNKEKHEIEFFEFGELSHEHEHEHCLNCTGEGEHHCCFFTDNDHIQNTKIKYINLDVLFLNFEKAEVSKTTVINLTKTLQNLITNCFTNSVKNLSEIKLIKIPPLLLNLPYSTDFCATFSVFRL